MSRLQRILSGFHNPRGEFENGPSHGIAMLPDEKDFFLLVLRKNTDRRSVLHHLPERGFPRRKKHRIGPEVQDLAGMDVFCRELLFKGKNRTATP
jgi:hypothetical protein